MDTGTATLKPPTDGALPEVRQRNMTSRESRTAAREEDEDEEEAAGPRPEKKALLRPLGWPSAGRVTGKIVAGPGDVPRDEDEAGGPAMDHDNDNESDSGQRVVLNVGGVRHETRLSTLRAIPNTRLSRLADAHTQFILPQEGTTTPSPLLTTTPTPTLSVPPCEGMSPPLTAALLPQPTEYFFDRHPSVFNAIIDFYRTALGQPGLASVKSPIPGRKTYLLLRWTLRTVPPLRRT